MKEKLRQKTHKQEDTARRTDGGRYVNEARRGSCFLLSKIGFPCLNIATFLIYRLTCTHVARNVVTVEEFWQAQIMSICHVSVSLAEFSENNFCQCPSLTDIAVLSDQTLLTFCCTLKFTLGLHPPKYSSIYYNDLCNLNERILYIYSCIYTSTYVRILNYTY